WQMLLGLAGLATGFLSGGTALAAGAVLFAAGQHQPADPDRAAADGAYAQEYTLTTAAALTVGAVFDGWVADGTVPQGSERPPSADPASDHPAIDYQRRFDRWLAQLPGGYDGSLANRAARLGGTFLDAAGAGASVAT
ncbi:MAG: hypothetical protein WCC60_23430, partial [Ilumatobacteraceae bacterium]